MALFPHVSTTLNLLTANRYFQYEKKWRISRVLYTTYVYDDVKTEKEKRVCVLSCRQRCYAVRELLQTVLRVPFETRDGESRPKN